MAAIERTENRALPPTGQLTVCKAISKLVSDKHSITQNSTMQNHS